MPAESCERDVVHLDRLEHCLDGMPHQPEVELGRLLQRGAPEFIEIVRVYDGTPIRVQASLVEIGQHQASSFGFCALSSPGRRISSSHEQSIGCEIVQCLHGGGVADPEALADLPLSDEALARCVLPAVMARTSSPLTIW